MFWKRLLLTIALALLLTLPAWMHGQLIGSGGAEVYGHAWTQEWAAADWPAWPLGTNLALGTEHRAVIDPLPTWIFAALPLNLMQAWNLRVLLSLILAGLGGGRLAEAVARGGFAMGMVGVMTAPIFLGSVVSGLTEDFSWGLVLFALADLWEGRPIRGGLLLGISAGCGLYLAWLGGLAAVFIGGWRMKEHWKSWILGGIIAGALSVGFALPFWGRLSADSGDAYHRQTEPFWKLNPWSGSDLASFWVPGKQATDGVFVREHPTYLGYGSLGLALMEVSPLWGGVLGSMAVALGPELSWRGEPLGIKNPAVSLFQLLPFGNRWHHHARVMLLGQALLSLLAVRGAAKRPVLLKIAPILILCENLFFSPIPFPLPGASVESPTIYQSLSKLPPGPLLVLGAAGPGIHPQKLFYDQQAHGRKLLHDPDQPGPPPRKIPSGTIVVALGGPTSPVRQEAVSRFGVPTIETEDGAAWQP